MDRRAAPTVSHFNVAFGPRAVEEDVGASENGVGARAATPGSGSNSLQADDITIDLAGFAILGPNTCSYTGCSTSGAGGGVVGSSAVGVSVHDGTVEGTGAKGIELGEIVLTACVAGYHMASLWEIRATALLTYDKELGFNSFADQGDGSPEGETGWVRTGYVGTSSNQASANCQGWRPARSPAHRP